MSKKKSASPPEAFNLPPVGVETHAHLDFPDFAQDLDEVLERAARAGIAWIGNIFLGAEAYRRHRPRFEGKQGLFFTLGVHPHEASTVNESTLAEMERLFHDDPRLLAAGEIGLDFHWNRSPRDAQIRAFGDQLALAKDLDLPVVVHSRDAEEQTLLLLQDLGFKNRPLLWHCFGGGPELAEKILAFGWLMSIPGTVTYPRSTALRQSAAMIPLTRMVLETDCPFLPPQAQRGKRNEPAFAAYTAAGIAAVKGLPVEHVWSECAATAGRFFNLAAQTP